MMCSIQRNLLFGDWFKFDFIKHTWMAPFLKKSQPAASVTKAYESILKLMSILKGKCLRLIVAFHASFKVPLVGLELTHADMSSF